MKNIFLIALLALLVITNSCSNNQKQPVLSNADISKVVLQMSNVMIHDVTNPPLATRFFAYTCLAGYEVLGQNNKNARSMHGVLNQYPAISKPKALTGYN